MSSIDFTNRPVTGNLNVKWIHGSSSLRHRTDPPIQVHMYDTHTIIMRESKDISSEAPFMYLLFGNDCALLIDTGTSADTRHFPLRNTVDNLILDWLGNYLHNNYELIVIHTHGHNDHTSGDKQFSDRKNTTIVQKDIDSVQKFFKITKWPDGIGHYDLGRRVLDILPTPGHDSREITIYDPWTEFLITGDLVYPGRLYAFDFSAFIESLNKLVIYAKKNPISHIMGCHIEMTSIPTKDYPVTLRYQPDEPPLEMTSDQLVSVRDAAESVRNSTGVHAFNDFIIFHGPCYWALFKQFIRASWLNLKHKLHSN